LAPQPTSRTRSLPSPRLGQASGTIKPLGYPRFNAYHDPPFVVRPGTQTTVSEGHPFQSRNKRGLTGDLGGPFFTSKSRCDFDSSNVVASGTGIWGGSPADLYYKGPILAIQPPGPNSPSLFPSANYSPDGHLEALGSTAVANCKPTNSPADLGVALGEIFKDGLPSLAASASWKDRSKSAKAAGDDYLNVQFGWLPLVSDVKKTAETMRRARAAIEQYERDAGRVVRRRYEFPVEHKREETVLGRSWPYGPSLSLGGDFPTQPLLTKVEETSVRRWFSGAFVYHLPSGYDSRKTMDKAALFADKLLGLNLSPDTLWNLAPWSWAVDWFSSTGDVISNITDLGTDGLVMQYGYIMEHSVHSVTYTSEATSVCFQKVPVRDVSFVTETKKRVPANPYGFGVDFSDLSPKRLSILAALGLSRRG